MLHFVACLRSQVRCSLSLSKAGVHLALLCPLIGILCLPSLAQYNTGLPTVGKTGSPTDSQTLIDAKQFLSGSCNIGGLLKVDTPHLGGGGVIAFPHFAQTATVVAPCGNYPFSEYHFVLSRMATLPYSSMGMARSGALLLVMKLPVAME